MKATTAKGLSDLRTASTRRIRCKTRRNGTAHLDIYLLNMEKQRLDTELTCLGKRRTAISERRSKICEEISKLQRETEQESASRDLPEPLTRRQVAAPAQGKQPWKKMALEY